MKMNKTATALLLTAALCAAPVTTAFAAETASTEEVVMAETALANPMKEVTAEELTAETGVTFPELSWASDVHFFTIDDGTAHKIAQMTFTVGSQVLCVRGQVTEETDAYDLTGNYFEPTNTLSIKVNNFNATLLTGDDVASVFWLDGDAGINYSIGCGENADNINMEAVANIIFSPIEEQIEEFIEQLSLELSEELESEGVDLAELSEMDEPAFEEILEELGEAIVDALGQSETDSELTDSELESILAELGVTLEDSAEETV